MPRAPADRSDRIALVQDTNVASFLQSAGIPFSTHPHTPVRNAQQAREAGLNFDQTLLTKTLVFHLQGRWLLVWLRAMDKLDYKALSRAVRADRRMIRFATEQQLFDAFGWEPGGAAPVPLASDCDLLVDDAVAEMQTAFIGGGRCDVTIEIEPLVYLSKVSHSKARLTGQHLPRQNP